MFVSTDVKGRAFAYRDESALPLSESLSLQVCNTCDEIRESAADSRALDSALQRSYAALHRAMASDAMERLTRDGWRQVEIERVMALSNGYLSKVLRGEKVLTGSTLRHLIHLSLHPRAALKDLASFYPEIPTLIETLRQRGALRVA
jgi:hypothetical protein